MKTSISLTILLQNVGHDPSQNGPKSGHRAIEKLPTRLSRSKKCAEADSEVEKAGCGASGVDFEPNGKLHKLSKTFSFYSYPGFSLADSSKNGGRKMT